jgi:fructose-bisphosphate aldolase class I
MDTEKLEHIAKTLVASGKGILAAAENNVVLEKRFEAVGVHFNEETRREYRELLITAPGAEQNLSGVLLREEGLFQSTENGQLFREYLKNHHVLPGIAVDKHVVDLPGFPGEKITEGLDALDHHMHAFAAAGAFFAKWRVVVSVGEGTPTDEAIGANTLAAARFARICQEAGVVPVVEVCLKGDYSAERAEEITAHVYDILFPTMRAFRVHLPGAVLKAAMIVSHGDAAAPNHDEVADRTCRVLYDHVPHELGGVVFADCGQTAGDALASLNKIVQRGPHPWGVTFAFGKSLNDQVLRQWAEQPKDTDGPKAILTDRLAQAAAASKGELDQATLGDEAFSPYGQD